MREADVYKSVVITGGGGMLAHALAEALRARGVGATLVRRAECDVADRADVERMFGTHRPTLVLNCAAHTKVDLCEEQQGLAQAINGDGPRYLAEAAREYGTKLTHFSTDFVFDGHADRPYLPTDATTPLSVYGRSKLAGEQAVETAAPVGWLTLRTAWLFGRHGHCFPQTILKFARAGKPLQVVDDQHGSPTSTADLAVVSLQLIDKATTGLFHVTGGGQTTWFEFARRTLEVFGVKAELSPISTAAWTAKRPHQATRPRYSVLDCSATEALIGRRMEGWENGLHDYAVQELAAPV